MGRPKGGSNRQYAKEEKLRIVSEVMAGKSVLEMARESGIHKSVVQRWAQTYAEQGEAGLTPKRKPGNPLAMYSSRKELSEVEQLRYELAKAQLEIAQLKKAQ